MVYRSFVLALLMIVSLVVPAKPTAAQTATGPPCAARKNVVAYLHQVIGERLVGSGLSDAGLLFEVYADLAGGWTIISTAPTGTTCLVAHGQAWEAPEERTS